MADFRQFLTIFLLEFINIGPVYIRGWVGGARGWGGVGGARGWGGWWQKLNQRKNKTRVHAPTKGQYSTTRPRQTCTDSGSHIRSPQPTWWPPLAPFHQSWIYMVGKKHSGKADQSTLASGGSEHA